ncbi:hypothetical protein PV394_33435 [Streptomyces sp. NE06-03E]|uniref:hypothetical protein n=1 Tax=Streptomyces sp. NE06-03E TaxID=3028695 RepID=UPI0029AD8990|nr:hypothetical protein [Streptomyces sp. NE06-03E]MDX3059985.1 hypothetical protein [Streptomyces sp. NE06-03E]
MGIAAVGPEAAGAADLGSVAAGSQLTSDTAAAQARAAVMVRFFKLSPQERFVEA